jgi:hypothetical protein
VLPVLTPGVYTLFTSASHPSYLELPLRAMGPVAAAEAAPLPARVRIASIAPNPTAGPASIRYAAASASRILFLLTDLLGRTVLQWEEEALIAGDHVTSLDGSGIAPGWYQLTACSRDGVSTARLIIRR